ncbi:MAG: hypothetical protein CSA11_11215 [Chloroflexi bacterium]|nr:MAG: hypothetical protein CSA11_11215 [Chloroflexota bacterium]
MEKQVNELTSLVEAEVDNHHTALGTGLRLEKMQRIADNFNVNVPDLRHNDEENFEVHRTS